ncbi:MAG: substrate-binding domain-containing protein [Bacteroidota bacterium]
MRHLVFIFTALLFVGCASSEPDSYETSGEKTPLKSRADGSTSYENATEGNIIVAADESFRPIMEAMQEVYTLRHNKAKIKVVYLPAEEAIKALIESDSIRLAVVARTLRSDESDELISQNTSGKIKPIAQDALALVVHSSNTISRINTDQLSGIVSGEVTQWSELGLKNEQDLSLVFDHVSSSSIQFLRDSVLKGGAIAPKKGFAAGNTPDVIAYVSKNPQAMGIIGLGWISDKDGSAARALRSQVKVLAMVPDGECPYENDAYEPYQGPMKAGCYPLVRTVFAISREVDYGLGTGFINYMADASRGQRLVLKAGLIPAIAPPRKLRFPVAGR